MSEKIKTTRVRYRYDSGGSECKGLRVLHYNLRAIHVGDDHLPNMDSWLLVRDDDAVCLVVLWPTLKDWPIHALSCGDTAEGDGIRSAIRAALKDYAERHPHHPPGVPT